MAFAFAYQGFDGQSALTEAKLRLALAELAPSWLARPAEPFQELVIAPANDLSRHIVARWPDRVGPARSLITVARHIETEVEMLRLPQTDSLVGLVLADGAAEAFTEVSPMVGYDLKRGDLLQDGGGWNRGDPAWLLAGAAALDQDDIEAYLRLQADAAIAPLADQTLDELTQWSRDLAAMKASLQASLMQGADPMALGDILQSLKSLTTQGAALRSVVALAKKQPDEARHHAEVRRQAASARGILETLIGNGKLPPDAGMKLLGMLNRLTRAVSDKPLLAQSGLARTIVAKIAARANRAQPQVPVAGRPRAGIAAAFRTAAGATVIRFPASLQTRQRLAAPGAGQVRAAKAGPAHTAPRGGSAAHAQPRGFQPVAPVAQDAGRISATPAARSSVFSSVPFDAGPRSMTGPAVGVIAAVPAVSVVPAPSAPAPHGADSVRSAPGVQVPQSSAATQTTPGAAAAVAPPMKSEASSLPSAPRDSALSPAAAPALVGGPASSPAAAPAPQVVPALRPAGALPPAALRQPDLSAGVSAGHAGILSPAGKPAMPAGAGLSPTNGMAVPAAPVAPGISTPPAAQPQPVTDTGKAPRLDTATPAIQNEPTAPATIARDAQEPAPAANPGVDTPGESKPVEVKQPNPVDPFKQCQEDCCNPAGKAKADRATPQIAETISAILSDKDNGYETRTVSAGGNAGPAIEVASQVAVTMVSADDLLGDLEQSFKTQPDPPLCHTSGRVSCECDAPRPN